MMANSMSNQKPHSGPSGRSHARSQSSPYFQHTRSFISQGHPTQVESNTDRTILPLPTTSSSICATPQKPHPARLQKHNRSLTATTIPKHPTITTDIKIESSPAALSSSIFSGSNTINFSYSPPASPILSPRNDRWSFLPTFKTDKVLPERSPSPLRISAWFQGESSPVALGIASSPTREMANPFKAADSPIARDSFSQPPRLSKPNSTISSFFTGKATTTVLVPQDASNDEYYNLNIKQALQPHGQADPFSPSSFKNLQQTAEGLLARMQVAYRQRVLTIRALKAEKEAQEEEYDEAMTRANHFQTQLDSLSSCLETQNDEIQRLTAQLREERRLRQEEADRNKTIRLVHTDHPLARRARSRTSLGSTTSVSTPSIVSDAEFSMSETSEPPRFEDGAFVSPMTPRSIDWPQSQMMVGTNKMFERINQTSVDTTSDMIQENIHLQARVEHLEKELDSCLELLKGV